MERNSRLTKRLERQTRKSLYLTILGIIVVFFLIIKFGIPLLINFSTYLGSRNDKTQSLSTTNNTPNFVPPPILNPTFSATNSATVNISGSATAKQTISLYVNDEVVDKTQAKDNGTFTFQNVTLDKGSNTIKAKASDDQNKDSDFSDPLTIKYLTQAPNLSVDSPSDNQTFSKDNNNITVSGKTDAGDKVTVNGFWAIVDDSGKYTYTLHLNNGDNTIKVVSTDDAGNKTEVDKKVTYNP